jgi:hypothetical protein
MPKSGKIIVSPRRPLFVRPKILIKSALNHWKARNEPPHVGCYGLLEKATLAFIPE